MAENTDRQPFDREEVRKRLNHDAAELLHDETLQSDERSHQADALEQRLKVLQVYDSTLPSPKRKRGVRIILFGIVLLLITILYAVRIPRTDVELALTLTDINFTMTEQWPILEKMMPLAVRIFPLQEVQLPRSTQKSGEVITGKDLDLSLGKDLKENSTESIKLKDTKGRDITIGPLTAKGEKSSGLITLTNLEVPKDTSIWLTKTDVENQYRLSLEVPEGNDLNFNIGVMGEVVTSLAGSKETFSYSAPRKISLKSTSNRISLDLTFPDKAQLSLSPQLHVQDLSFLRIDQIISPKGTSVKEVSTIQSGSLYFSVFNDREYTLRIGEKLHLEGAEGIIRELSLKNNSMVLSFHGRVGKIKAGWDKKKQKNLMPTCLEWLARPVLTAYWGAIISIFTLGLGVYRWWKVGK